MSPSELKELNIALLLCDDVDAEDQDRYGTYTQIFEDSLEAADANLKLRAFEVYKGDFPKGVNGFDGYLISGSRDASYDNKEWIVRLREFVRECFAAKKKVVGICFGHQLLAHALGGETQKAEVGWGIGAQHAKVSEAQEWMLPPADEYELIVVHQDQVVKLPPNFRVIAANDFCPVSMFVGANDKGEDLVLGIQGHPEFDADFCRARIESRREELGEAAYKNAHNSLDTADLDSPRVLQWLAQFLRI